jgi:hypothetical protein
MLEERFVVLDGFATDGGGVVSELVENGRFTYDAIEEPVFETVFTMGDNTSTSCVTVTFLGAFTLTSSSAFTGSTLSLFSVRTVFTATVLDVFSFESVLMTTPSSVSEEDPDPHSSVRSRDGAMCSYM